MGIYKLSTTTGASLASMTEFTNYTRFDPFSSGILYGDIVQSMSNKVFPQAPYSVLTWNAINVAEFYALMTALGISESSPNARIAVYTLKRHDTTNVFAQYNVSISYPFLGDKRRYQPKGFVDVQLVLKRPTEYTNP